MHVCMYVCNTRVQFLYACMCACVQSMSACMQVCNVMRCVVLRVMHVTHACMHVLHARDLIHACMRVMHACTCVHVMHVSMYVRMHVCMYCNVCM